MGIIEKVCVCKREGERDENKKKVQQKNAEKGKENEQDMIKQVSEFKTEPKNS